MNFLNKDGLNYLIQKIKSLELKNFSNTTGFAKYDSSTLGNYSFTFTIKSLDLANNKVLLETTDSSIGDWISSKGYRYASIPFDTAFENCKLTALYLDNITTLGKYAFANNNLSGEVRIKPGISIPDNCF